MSFAFRKPLLSLLLVIGMAVLLLLAFVWSGIYNVGADAPHTRPILALMKALRDRSIEAHSRDVTPPPNLGDPQLVLNGAGHYAEMCTGCHLAPGMEETEIRPGLYPQPPDLSKTRVDPKVAFWAIKHGIKMTAMPAWGSSHDDPTIWSMVAFLQKLPTLTPAQYRDLVAKAPPDEEMEGGHHHHGQEEDAPTGSAHHHDAEGDHHDDGPAADNAGHATMATSAAIEGYAPKAVPAAERVADTFHAALQEGNRQQVMALLAPDATISEGGEARDRATYAAGRLGEDIAFLRTAQVHPLFLGSMPMGKTAMVATRSEVHATAQDKPLTLLRTEILTLKDTGKDWLITRVEWSSEQQP